MNIKRKWLVSGWLEGSSFDNAQPADYSVIVDAINEEQADEYGDAKLRDEFGTCDVIVSIPYATYAS